MLPWRVFVYATTCVCLVSVFVATVCCVGWWWTLTDLARVEEMMRETREARATCAVALQRADAKLEWIDRWMETARPRDGAPGVGGR